MALALSIWHWPGLGPANLSSKMWFYSDLSTCGLGLEDLASTSWILASTSASEFWPWPRHIGLV